MSHYIMYKGLVYEAKEGNSSGTTIGLERFDSDQILLIPRGSKNAIQAVEEEISQYKKEENQYLHALRMKEAADKGYLCYAMDCKGYRVSGSDFCHDHMPTPDPGFYEPEPDPGSFEGQLDQVLAELGELLRKKNKDYGSSYDKTVEELGETVILIRIMDKFNRLKQLIKSGDDPEVEETIEETLSDLVGYGIIELVRRRRL